MNRKYTFLIVLMLFNSCLAFAQNAPQTKSGNILNATAGSITIPITVSDFENIGAFDLKLSYDPAALTYTSSDFNSAFSGMLITKLVNGIITVEWTKTDQAITLLDESILFELNFTYISGSTTLTWIDDGTSCEYKNDALTSLNDSPTADFYRNGYITSHGAPITYAPIITDAATGAVDVPLTVDNFWDIGKITLAFTYDPSVLTYSGNTPNSIFEGNMTVESIAATGGMKKITVEWSSTTPQSLTDGSSILTLHFSYASDFYSNTNYSELKWNTNGADCEYEDINSNTLFDLPYNEFYIDGLVAGQVAPVTCLPGISDAVGGNSVFIPITVDGFQNVSSVTLKFDYDPNVMTFVGSTQNSEFNNLMSVNSPASGEISISYYGSSVSIDDQEILATIEFSYISGTSALTFITNGSDCAYGDAYYNNLWDQPYEDFYINGVVASQVAPLIKAEPVTALQNTQISVPVTVKDFNNISNFCLTLDYDPVVLTYINATPNTAITSNFNDGTTNSGRIQVDWSGESPLSLSDETVLIYLNFYYSGGTSPLNWNNNGSSCEVKAGIAGDILYDQPTEDYYINGLVDAADFIWIGGTSNDWNTSSNWSDDIVPNNQSIVSIPNTPPLFWPTFSGDFTLGTDCKRLYLDDGSVMTVTGNMVIIPGNAFINNGAGILNVGGDWKNTGVFVPQTGEVVFTSQTVGAIPGGFLPENEVQNYAQTSTAASLTAITGGTSGPTGENAHSDVSIGFTFVYAGTEYTQARVSTNGWISLNLTGEDATAFDNSRLFFTSDPTTILAPWWDNLNADGSSAISYLTSGVTPNRIFTVEWKDMLSYSSGATTRLNFQVKLYETTNEIEFCYGSILPDTYSASEGASIGIKGPVGGTGDFIEATTSSTNTAINTLTSENNWPMLNYKFSPPPDTVTFYKMTLGAGSILNIETDVKITCGTQ